MDKIVQDMPPIDTTLSTPITDNTVPAAITTATAITSILQTIWNKLLHLYNNKANLASPAFTGTPTASTAAQTVNNTQLATTAYVQTAVTTKPSVVDIPFAAAWGSDGAANQSWYSKNQFGEITVGLRAIKTSGTVTGTETVATLPAGFRPRVYMEVPIMGYGGTTGNIVGAVSISTNGNIQTRGTPGYAGIFANFSFPAA